MMNFGAPWSKLLIVITTFASLVLSGMIFAGIFLLPQAAPQFARASLILGPLAMITYGLVSMVRGYQLEGRQLIIQRLGWVNKIDLSNLVSATHDPALLAGSIRTFGNGGFFSFSGCFRNEKLGSYHAYATDIDRAVVLGLPNKTLVITPSDPKEFIRALKL